MQAHLQLDGTRFGHELRQRLYDESSMRFVAAFARSLTDLSREDVSWRFMFMLGAYQYALADTGRIEVISDGLCSASDFACSLKQIVPFLSAAMRSPQSLPAHPRISVRARQTLLERSSCPR